jgi:hypothetical protein
VHVTLHLGEHFDVTDYAPRYARALAAARGVSRLDTRFGAQSYLAETSAYLAIKIGRWDLITKSSLCRRAGAKLLPVPSGRCVVFVIAIS